MGIIVQMNHIVMRKPACQGSLLKRKKKIKSGQMDYVGRLVMSGCELGQQKGFNGLNYQAPCSSKEQQVN